MVSDRRSTSAASARCASTSGGRRRRPRPRGRRPGGVRARRAARRAGAGALVAAEARLRPGRAGRGVEPSPHRVEPPCPYWPPAAAGAAGSTWTRRAARAEGAIVREALRRTGAAAGRRVTSGGRAPVGFRTTLRLAVDADGRRGSRRPQRSGRRPRLRAWWPTPALAELLAGLRVAGADEVRCARRRPRASGRRGGRPTSVHAVGLPDRCAASDRTRSSTREVGGVRLRVSAASFFQTRPTAPRRWSPPSVAAPATAARPWSTPTAAWGCSPPGGAPSRRRAGRGIGVGVRRCPAQPAGRRATVVERRSRTGSRSPARWWSPTRRAGLGARPRQLAATGRRVLVLVSCDPVASPATPRCWPARLRRPTSVVVDLFPHTPHVEIVTRFDRRHPDRPTAPYRDRARRSD